MGHEGAEQGGGPAGAVLEDGEVRREEGADQLKKSVRGKRIPSSSGDSSSIDMTKITMMMMMIKIMLMIMIIRKMMKKMMMILMMRTRMLMIG